MNAKRSSIPPRVIVVIVIALVVITLNAIWRVRYYGAKEKEYREGLEAGRD